MHTFVFVDLAGFTALAEAMGDDEAVDIAERFHAEVAARAAEHGADVVKSIGDAMMLRATEARRAIEVALCVVHDVGSRHHFPAVRAGMHTGPAIERRGDWFGTTVNIAARVSGQASGGEVLLTDATRGAAQPMGGIELRERGRRELKNVAEPLLLYAAVREGSMTPDLLPIDPVCRMAVDPEHAAGRLTHAGTEYHFCSLDCVARFAAAPDAYAARR
jgi:class 3 adenylate cyclase/YHS domain-containing protein